LPELADLPADKIHQPELLSFVEQQSHQIMLGTSYPEPLIDTSKWSKS
jgi:deoxyribodipyrimidine photo-lyase